MFEGVIVLQNVKLPKTKPSARKREPLALWDSGDFFKETQAIRKKRSLPAFSSKQTRFASPWSNEISLGEETVDFASDNIDHSSFSAISSISNKLDFLMEEESQIVNKEILHKSDATLKNSETTEALSGKSSCTIVNEMEPNKIEREQPKTHKSRVLLSNKEKGLSSQNTKPCSIAPAEKAASCSDLSSKFITGGSASGLESNLLFFNEKGWPVKVMRLTEDSPPKASKPWPSRSLPVATVNKTSRKEKSIFTQNNIRTSLSKENKENKSYHTVKEKTYSSEKNAEKAPNIIEQAVGEKSAGLGLKSDLKLMLGHLDETVNKLSSENATEPQEGNKQPIKKQPTSKPNRPKTIDRKSPRNKPKEHLIGPCSARSNKYNSKEMKAYIHAKRTERKLQVSEETKKKQAMMEMQKKNLEKLREKASLVLKKTTTKSIEETKPRWQGPLEVDISEESPAAIHIFESKIPTAKKPKLSVKSDADEVSPQRNSEKQDSPCRKEEKKNTDALESDKSSFKAESDKFSNASDKLIMDKENKVLSKKEKSVRTLRLSRNRVPVKDPNVISALEEVVAEKELVLGKELEKVRNGCQTQLSTHENTCSPDARRRTFDIPYPFKESPQHSFHSPGDNSQRKRHPSSPLKYNNSPVKKTCSNENLRSPYETPTDNASMEKALQKVQEEMLQNPKEDKGAEWFHSLKADAFNMMNTIKMKSLTSQKNTGADKKERLKQKFISVRSSHEDETDAPSIVSMEEDFKILPEPLRLSDIHLPIPTRSASVGDSSWSPRSSMAASQANSKAVETSMKTSVSSFASEAPPLVVPESVQHLKLQSKRSQSDLSSSASLQLSSLGFSELAVRSNNPLTASSQEVRRPESSISSTVSSKTSFDKHSTQHYLLGEKVQPEPNLQQNQDQVEIGQVLSSAALLLQFHAELSRLDAFDQSLAQVIAAERLYHMHSHPHVPDSHRQVHTQSQVSVLDTSHAPQVSGSNISFSHLTAVSPESDKSSSRNHSGQPVSQHLSSHSGHTSSLPSVEEVSFIQESAEDEMKELSPKPSSSVSLISTAPASFSPKNIHFLKVLIEDAEFQRRQHQLLYKTQEDILHANYKAALNELSLRFSDFWGSNSEEASKKESEARVKIEEHYKSTIANIRETRNHVLLNWSKRIEDLVKEREHLKKLMKKKQNSLKLRSAETSPKKQTPNRSTSMTSVVESSSSESLIMTQAFDDKKRQETDKEKVVIFNRRKVEKEILKRLQEEVRKVQELEKVERTLKPGRSRRDKSTSPLESVPETLTSTKDVACSVNEESVVSQNATSSLRSVEEGRGTDMYNSESFESPESSETPRQPRMINRPALASKPFVAPRFNNKSKVLIKVPLSPRLQIRSKRRCSSGSDESLLLSQNETQSEQSDYEVKIAALKEQKRQRYAELNRLQRELKRAQREQLKATEASLIKQIQVYDSYIEQTKKQLEEVSAATMIVRPQIKHPRVSDRFLPRQPDKLQRTSIIEDQSKQPEPSVSDVETNSIKSVSEASSIETTIQSSVPAQVTEQSSPKTEIGEDSGQNALRSDSDGREDLSSVVTEVSNSNETHISEKVQSNSRSSISDPSEVTDANDESQWVDAQTFFEQLEHPNEILSQNSNDSKESIKESLSSATSETEKLQILTSPSQNASKEISAVEEVIKSEDAIISLDPELYLEDSQTASSHNKTVEEEEQEANSSTLDKQNNSDELLDKGSVVSIISQAPSCKSQKSSGSDCHNEEDREINLASHKSDAELEPSCDTLPSDNEPSVSITVSEKSYISETALLIHSQSNEASLSSDLNVTSQGYSEEDGDDLKSSYHSDAEETSGSSQSEVIKVFVSNKNIPDDDIPDDDDVTIEEDNGVNLNETYTVSKDNGENEDTDGRSKVVGKITDDILSNLLKECCTFQENQFTQAKDEKTAAVPPVNNLSFLEKDITSKNKVAVDDFTKGILNKFLQDATDCMLKINEAKNKALVNCDKFTSNFKENGSAKKISNQLLDALALEGSGIHLDKAHEGGISSPGNKSTSNEVEFNDGNESEVFWFDEDVHPVSLQAQREAEELRLKQLQIEQEIKQLEQAQENIPSYYYVREIPNKPPPPYTPPGQSSTQTKDTLDPVPTRQEDIESLVTMATQSLVGAWMKGGDLTAILPSEQYSSKQVGNQVYKKFLFDLVKQIFIDDTASSKNEKDNPPWERTGCRIQRLVLPKLTEESVRSFVLKKVRVLFGFEPSSIKENLIIQWSRKKRDRVDELLVRESQEEEQEWTDYSKCEVAVKNNVALSIFDGLLDEATLALSNAFQKKRKFFQKTQL